MPQDPDDTNAPDHDLIDELSPQGGPEPGPLQGRATGSVGDRSQIEVEQRLADQGFEGQFGARPDASVLCFTCHREFPASDLDGDWARRVEGESDPSDMAILVPVTCPHCATSGTLALQFGPMASVEEAEVIRALDR